MSQSYYPVFLDLEGRVAVVIGGGAVAARKAESLQRSGARVIAVAPRFTEAFQTLPVELRHRGYEPHDLDGATLVIAATDDVEINKRVAAECRGRRILVNVVDDTELCDFIVPAVIERGSIQLAISTGGQSPALARRLKADLQQVLGSEYAEINDILGELRERAKQSPKLPHDHDRKQFFDEVLGSGALELLREGRRAEAYARIAEVCRNAGVEEPRA
ncbi:MAG TPA: bifunctional precorrin-2 dehydrogenase/sirohydrochlorin ferrochelatase [Thermoanaerobaculia bacterium]